MEKICIEMPIVSECAVSECAYNLNKACQARAITIGNGITPGCDTFLQGSQQAAEGGRTAGIGACKTAGCKFNEGLECMADSIRVGHVQNNVNCMTFAAR
jgi:hypothetical protein